MNSTTDDNTAAPAPASEAAYLRAALAALLGDVEAALDYDPGRGGQQVGRAPRLVGAGRGALSYLQGEIQRALETPKDDLAAARAEGRQDGLLKAARWCEEQGHIFKGHATDAAFSRPERAYFYDAYVRMISAGAGIRVELAGETAAAPEEDHAR